MKMKLLTQRQLDILKLKGAGLTDKEIGVKLKISPRTIRTHLDGIRLKFGATSVVQLIFMLTASGILSSKLD